MARGSEFKGAYAVQTIQQRVFEGEVLEMDDKHFIDCRLTNCVLRYSGRALVIEKTRLQGCNYVFFGRARGTIHFLQMMGLLPPEGTDWGEFPEMEH